MAAQHSDDASDAVLGPQGSVRALVGLMLGAVLGGVLAVFLSRNTG